MNVAFLSTDIQDFLKLCTKELDETFSSTCTFPKMSKALMEHVSEMKLKVEQMRKHAQFLSPGKAPTLPETGTIKATSQVSTCISNNVLCLLY